MTAAVTELLRRGLHALRRSGVWWTVGIAAFALVNLAFWPSLESSDSLSSLQDLSGDLLEAFGAQNINTPAGYLDGQMFALMLPLLLSGMAIAMATLLTAGDEDAGRLELLHALPVSRRSVWLSRFAAATVTVLVVALTISIVTVVSTKVFSLDDVSASRVTAATFACAMLGLFHAAIGYLVAGSGRSRSASVGVAVLVLVAGYVVSFVFPLSESLAGAQKISPWYWAIGEQPVSNGIDLATLALLIGLTVVLVAIGTVLVERRDIRGA
jgi:ABC-2 type transport system permease protein